MAHELEMNADGTARMFYCGAAERGMVFSFGPGSGGGIPLSDLA